MPTYTPVNSIFDGPMTNLLSILCVLIEIVSRAHAKEKKDINTFTFGASSFFFLFFFSFSSFLCRFQSDGAARMAVKGNNH